MAWLCRNCGETLDRVRSTGRQGSWVCPSCGTETELQSTTVEPPIDASVETVFQPALMMDSILDELDAPAAEIDSATDEPNTETIDTDPNTLPAPYLHLEVDAFLLILGAPPGQERRALARAKTSFGRRSADIVLEDPAMSGQHFQIEAFGREFFLRDLDSRNGTYLNGTKVRYSQLLPGDQITAGKTSLIFRTSDDLIDRD